MKKIDLRQFTKEQLVVIPIVDGWGKAQGGRKVELAVEDGWYWVFLGNTVRLDRKARPAEVEHAFRDWGEMKRVYALGEEGIPINFDNFFHGQDNSSIEVKFLNLQPFEVAKIIYSYDRRYYYAIQDPAFQRDVLKQMKEAFEADRTLDNIKGVTPELRYYWLILNLQKQAYREFEELERMRISEAEKQKRIAEFQATFAGRLQKTIEAADGILLLWSKVNATSYMVHWKVRGTDQVVKSTIRDTMQILSLGFCASGHDREHSLASAVQLAKMYGRLYITRD